MSETEILCNFVEIVVTSSLLFDWNMDIIANIRNYGDQRLFLVPDANEPERKFYLVISQEDIDTPKATLILKDNKFVIEGHNELEFHEREELENFQIKLNVLAADVSEALSRGEDLSASDLPEHKEKVKPYDPELIDVRESPISVLQASMMITDKDINISPDFQRNVVWDSKRKSRLIESILLRIPLPAFYFSQRKDGTLSVVDGLQRLTAINDFMEGKLVLSELEYLTELNGVSYEILKKKHQLYDKRLRLTKLSAYIIQPESPVKVRYDIFRRLNTGGRPLNNQELRNCMASPELRESLKRMAQSEEFKKATGKSIDDVRMQAQEMALRFMRFWDWISKPDGIALYKGDMDYTLDEFTEEASQMNHFPFTECENAFRSAMINSSYLFGKHAFRKVFMGYTAESNRSLINKALFLSFAVVLSKFDPDKVKNTAAPGEWIGKLADIIDGESEKSRETMRLLSYGTNGVRNIRRAFEIAQELAQELSN